MDNLTIFVEGEDDILFFKRNILKLFYKKEEYNINVVAYQETGKKRFLQHLQTINRLGGNYIFISDFDFRPCITSKKNDRIKEFTRENFDKLDANKIFIVKNEIESWFLAGVDNNQPIFRNIDVPNDTEKTSKDYLERLLKKTKFDSRVDFFIEVSNYFNYDLAMQRNDSFRYFLKKLELK